MESALPSRKNSSVKTQFNPYGRPSAYMLRGNLQVYEMQELQWGINASLMSYEHELQRSSDNVSIAFTYNWVLNIFRICIWDPLWILTCPSVRVMGQMGHMVAQMPLWHMMK
jgi:hypothetical protein